jgi:uncharacterized membrane protein YdjX (TVP38/TMEM64 family)
MQYQFKRYIPLVLILFLMMIAYFVGVTHYLTFDMLREKHRVLKSFVDQHSVVAPLAFMGIYFLSTMLSVPGAVFLTLLGGFLFPLPLSTLYVVIGATCGASVMFLVARSAFGDILRKKVKIQTIQKMEKGFQENPVSYLLFLRFIPLFPFWMVNLVPAFFGVH